jgi:hypothetical protein
MKKNSFRYFFTIILQEELLPQDSGAKNLRLSFTLTKEQLIEFHSEILAQIQKFPVRN